MKDKTREDFEKWYRREVMRNAPEYMANQRFIRDSDGTYWDMWVRRAWQAWVASREAMK